MPQDVSAYLIFVTLSILLASIQYGYHIGELNIPQRVISCDSGKNPPIHDSSNLPSCIPMTEGIYSLVVSMLIAGGFLGSMVAPIFSDRFGRRWTLLVNNIFLATGSTITSLAGSVNLLLWGRFLIGIGCGIITVVAPTYISEIAPAALRGTLGAGSQLGLTIGVVTSQILGIFLSTELHWRYILIIGSALSLLQVAALFFCVESPRYLASKPGGLYAAKVSLQRLRGTKEVDEELNSWNRSWVAEEDGERRPLISDPHAGSSIEPVRASTTTISLGQLILSPTYNRLIIILFLVHTAQQFSGINAVVLYSTTIMSTIAPASSELITVSITTIGLFVTLLSAALMDRAGRRTLFLISAGSMSLFSLLLAIGIERNYPYFSAVTIIGFVCTFSIGLGPIPFLIIPEIADTQTVSAAGAFAFGVNWFSNFIVSAGFMTVRNLLGGGGIVFLLFAAFLAFVTFAGYKVLPETKGRSVEEVVKSNWAVTT